MADIVTHKFVSPSADGPDPKKLQPSHWNDTHQFIGGVNGQTLVKDDTAEGLVKWADASPHAYDSADHTGTLSWAKVDKTGALPADVGAAAASHTHATSGLSDGTNVALKNADNAFSAEQTITGLVKPTLGIQERSRTVPMGEWVTPTFAAGNFTGNNSMTWAVEAGDVTCYAYTLIGKTMTVSLSLTTTVLGGTPSTLLQVAIPGGLVAAKPMRNYLTYWDGSAYQTGVMRVQTAGTVIELQTNNRGNWPAGATAFEGQLTFEVQ